MTKKFKDLIQRKDNLFYFKNERVPFTGVIEKFHNDGLLASALQWTSTDKVPGEVEPYRCLFVSVRGEDMPSK